MKLRIFLILCSSCSSCLGAQLCSCLLLLRITYSPRSISFPRCSLVISSAWQACSDCSTLGLIFSFLSLMGSVVNFCSFLATSSGLGGCEPGCAWALLKGGFHDETQKFLSLGSKVKRNSVYSCMQSLVSWLVTLEKQYFSQSNTPRSQSLVWSLIIWQLRDSVVMLLMDLAALRIIFSRVKKMKAFLQNSLRRYSSKYLRSRILQIKTVRKNLQISILCLLSPENCYEYSLALRKR